jgi:hypothetical protein
MKFKSLLRWLFKEPLTYFVLLGSLVYYFYEPKTLDEDMTAKTIELPAEYLQEQKEKFARQHHRVPTHQELQKLIEVAVDEEVLFREAWRLNLYVGDEVVRKRMIQKARFILEDAKQVTNNIEPEINQRLAEFNAGANEIYVFGLVHYVFADVSKANSYQDAVVGLAPDKTPEPSLAISFPLGNTFENISNTDVDAKFGEGFVKQLDFKLANQWQGPIKSVYGFHVVKLTNITKQKNEAQDQAIEMIREQIAKEKTEQQWQTRLNKVKSRYTIVYAE